MLSALGVSSAFKFVNLTFAVVFSFSIYLISRRVGFGIFISLFALFLTIIPFFSPIRFTPFYPVYTDPSFMAILSLAMLALVYQNYTSALARA
jgi:hypothetical protein